MLEDKVILITGSNGGIGFAIAKLCETLGAKIVLHGRDESALQRAAQQLEINPGIIVADLMESEAPNRIIDAVIAEFGRIDGVVNNAACLDRNSIETVSDDSFEKIMTINVRAPLMLIQAALPHMKAQKTGGSIVNIGSTNAHCGAHNLLLYSMSKGAMMTATRNMGDALGGSKVRINQLNVGWTLTESEHLLQLSEGQPEDWLNHIPEAFSPGGTILDPAQIAQHVTFWLSDNSAPVTGQIIDVEQYPVIGRNKVSER